jgi:hypothetical protein
MKYIVLLVLLLLLIKIGTSNYVTCPPVEFRRDGTCDACSGIVSGYFGFGLNDAKIDNGEVIALTIPYNSVGIKEYLMFAKALSYALGIPPTTIYVTSVQYATSPGTTLFYADIIPPPAVQPVSNALVNNDGITVLIQNRVKDLFSSVPVMNDIVYGSPEEYYLSVALDNEYPIDHALPAVNAGDPAGCVLQAALLKAGFPSSVMAYYVNH